MNIKCTWKCLRVQQSKQNRTIMHTGSLLYSVWHILKKSICRARLFSSRLLKQFMDWASTSSCDRLFHLDLPCAC